MVPMVSMVAVMSAVMSTSVDDDGMRVALCMGEMSSCKLSDTGHAMDGDVGSDGVVLAVLLSNDMQIVVDSVE
jgi:hypothetical protein